MNYKKIFNSFIWVQFSLLIIYFMFILLNLINGHIYMFYQKDTNGFYSINYKLGMDLILYFILLIGSINLLKYKKSGWWMEQLTLLALIINISIQVISIILSYRYVLISYYIELSIYIFLIVIYLLIFIMFLRKDIVDYFNILKVNNKYIKSELIMKSLLFSIILCISVLGILYFLIFIVNLIYLIVSFLNTSF